MEPIGFAAGSLVAIALLPQVIKSWKSRSTKDIAISWTLINLSGQVLWIVYGFGVHSASLVTMSGLTLVMTVSLLILKVKNG